MEEAFSVAEGISSLEASSLAEESSSPEEASVLSEEASLSAVPCLFLMALAVQKRAAPKQNQTIPEVKPELEILRIAFTKNRAAAK